MPAGVKELICRQDSGPRRDGRSSADDSRENDSLPHEVSAAAASIAGT